MRLFSSKRVQTEDPSTAVERIEKEVQTSPEDIFIVAKPVVPKIELPLHDIDEAAKLAFRNAASLVLNGSASSNPDVKCVSLNCIRVLTHLYQLAERIVNDVKPSEPKPDF